MDHGSRHKGEVKGTRLSFSLPLPPSINKQYATLGKHRVLSWDAKEYRREAAQQLREHLHHGALLAVPLASFKESFLKLSFLFYFETPLRRDLDSGVKILQDIICEVLQINDNRVVALYAAKRVDKEHPRVDVRVKLLTSWKFFDLLPLIHPEPSKFLKGSGKRKRKVRDRSLEELAELWNQTDQ